MHNDLDLELKNISKIEGHVSERFAVRTLRCQNSSLSERNFVPVRMTFKFGGLLNA